MSTSLAFERAATAAAAAPRPRAAYHTPILRVLPGGRRLFVDDDADVLARLDDALDDAAEALARRRADRARPSLAIAELLDVAP